MLKLRLIIARYLPIGLIGILGFSDQEPSSLEPPPNIILIMADDLGYETIGANGGASYRTPEIDRMAANGIRFEHCYAQPLCTPSRVQLMTGIYNVRNYVRFGLLEEHQTTFGHLFQKAHYATCIIGKWQLGKDPMSPRRAGFDEHCLWQVREGRTDSTGRDTRYSQPVLDINGQIRAYAKDDYGPKIISEYGLDFIERSTRRRKPFLLYYSMILTHCPFSPTPDSPEWMVDDTAVMHYKGKPSYFADMVAYMDKLVGDINRKLEELGIKDHTLVLFTGDNGTDEPVVSLLNGRNVAGAKGESTDGGTRVPLIAQWPGQISAGSTSRDLIDFSDMLPTICEAAGIAVPDSLDIDGRSFLPQMRGHVGHPRNWVYSWYSREGKVKEARVFARNHRYKRYDTGEFYDVPADDLEKHPLSVESLNAEAREIYELLGEVLEKYAKRRLEDVPN